MQLKSKLYIASTLTLLGIFTLPQFLSTKVGNRILSKAISSQDSKINLVGKISWLSPLYFDEVGYDSKSFKLQAQGINTNFSLIDYFFTKKKLECELDAFNLYLINQNLIKKQEAGFLSFVTIHPKKRSINLLFKNGSIYSAGANETLVNQIEGSLDFEPGKISSLEILGNAQKGGLIQTKAMFDLDLMNFEVNLNLKSYPLQALPDFKFKNRLGDNLNLELFFSGSMQKGAGSYRLNTDALAAQGSFSLLNSLLEISGPTSFNFSYPKKLEIGEYVCENTEVFGKVFSGKIDLINNFKMENLEMEMNGALDTLALKQSMLKNINLSSRFKQNDQNQLETKIAIKADQNNLLNIQGYLPTSLKDPMEISCDLNGFPLDMIKPGLSPFFGPSIYLNTKLSYKDESFTANASGQTDFIKNIALSLKTDGYKAYFDALNLSVEHPKVLASLQTNSLEIDLEKANFKSLSSRFAVYKLIDLDPSLFPIEGKLKAQNLDKIEIVLDSQTISGHAFGALTLDPFNFKLTEQADLKFKVPSSLINYPLEQKDLSGLIKIKSGSDLNGIKAALQLDPVTIASSADLRIKDASCDLSYDLKTSYVSAKTSGTVSSKVSKDSPFLFSIEAYGSELEKAQLKLDNPPLKALSPFIPDVKPWAEFLGDNLVLNIDLKKEQSVLSYGFSLNSDQIKAKGAFALGNEIKLLSPLTVNLKLDSLKIPYVNFPKNFNLKKQTTINLELLSLSIPKNDLKFEALDFKGSISIPDLYLNWDQKNLQLQGFYSKLNKSKGSSSLDYQASSDLYSSYQKTYTSGRLDATLNLKNIYGPLEALNLDSALIDLKMKLDQFPMLALDFLFQDKDSSWSRTFGSTFSAQATIQHSPTKGAIQIDAFSSEAFLKLGAIKTQDYYTLSDDAIFQMKLTSSVAPLFFKNKPLGIESMTSNDLIAVRLKKNNTQASLFPFDPKTLSFDELSIDLGKVQVVSETIIPQALTLLKSQTRTNPIPVWFQPIKCSAKLGMIDVKRFDFLVLNEFPMCFWGSIDLVKQNLGLILGLPAICLQKAFGILEMPPNYVLQVPIKGTFDNPQIDSKKATAKITAILALQKGGDLFEQFGGKRGSIVGGILKEFSKIPDADKKAPEPTLPFPWDENQKSSNAENLEKRKIRSKDSAFEQIKKMLF